MALSPATTSSEALTGAFSGPPPALVTYLTAGHPDRRASLEALRVVDRYADVIEVGVPFSDPLADGPVIQQATQIALQQGMTVPRALRAVAELRRRATPVSVGVADTSLGQEDVQSAGFAAAENLRAAAALSREVTAIELITARQAWWLRGTGPAPGLRPVAAPLLDAVPPVDDDRPLGDDVSRVVHMLHLG